MHKRLLPLVLFTLAIVPTATAHAQERGQVGLTMGYPASIGVIWHVSDTVAIRPDFTLSQSSTETETAFLGSTSSVDSWSFGAGASAIFYMGKWDNVRSYVTPRVAYGRSSFDTSSLSTPSATNTVSAAFSFGVLFSPARKFSVYGETGYGFNRATSDVDTPIGTISHTSTNWGNRAGVGVIFYFGRN